MRGIWTGNSWKSHAPHLCLLQGRKKDAENNYSPVLHVSVRRWTISRLPGVCREPSFEFKGGSNAVCDTLELGVAEATAEGSQLWADTCGTQQEWRGLQMGRLGKPETLQHTLQHV